MHFLLISNEVVGQRLWQ